LTGRTAAFYRSFPQSGDNCPRGGAYSSRFERLVYVLDDVVDVLDTDRQPDHLG